MTMLEIVPALGPSPPTNGSFDGLEPAMTALAALLRKIDWIEDVGIGPPEIPETTTMCWITMGDPDVIGSVVTGTFDLRVNLIVWFGYLVAGAEEEAEYKVARGLVGVTRLLIANRNGPVEQIEIYLDKNVRTMGLPQASIGGPGYASFAGQEFRVYPIGVLVEFRE